MNTRIIGRVAGALALTLTLAGCIDMTSEIEIKSDSAVKATTITTMGAEFYPMIKAMKDTGSQGAGAEASADDSDFCTTDGAQLVENQDGSATCTEVYEGAFDGVTGSSDAMEDAAFTVVSPGVVRVSFKTEGMASDLTEGQESDPQTTAMMKAYFEGHSATLRVKGKKITDTNLTLGADGTSAEVVIPFTSLLDGTADLPPEYFAVVDTN
jgi:hypothetical protein